MEHTRLPNKAPAREVARTIREKLVELFPLAFMPKGAPKKPLKIGIRSDIRAIAPEFRGRDLYIALQDYTRGNTYRRELRSGAIRIGLDGKAAGVVTAEEAAAAVARGHKAKPPKDRSLRPVRVERAPIMRRLPR